MKKKPPIEKLPKSLICSTCGNRIKTGELVTQVANAEGNLIDVYHTLCGKKKAS